MHDDISQFAFTGIFNIYVYFARVQTEQILTNKVTKNLDGANQPKINEKYEQIS